MERREVAALAVGMEHWMVEVVLGRPTVLLGTAARVVEVDKLLALLDTAAAVEVGKLTVLLDTAAAAVVVEVGGRVVALL